jgi:hypothetical protein
MPKLQTIGFNKKKSSRIRGAHTASNLFFSNVLQSMQQPDYMEIQNIQVHGRKDLGGGQFSLQSMSVA